MHEFILWHSENVGVVLLRNHQCVKLIDGMNVEERIRLVRFVDLPRLNLTGGYPTEDALLHIGAV